jgi:UDP-GlcNAc:undecaprenyl-phosphate GlcNAc-1-phosphate transferase
MFDLIKRIYHRNIQYCIMMNNSINMLSSMAPLWLLSLFGLLLALIITYFSIPSIVVIAKKKMIFAIPNGKASHNGTIPNLGGMAILFGFIISTLLVAGIYLRSEMVYIISGLIILFLAGIKDDLVGIHPRLKLAAQVVAAALVTIFANIRIIDFQGLFNLHHIPYVPSILITVCVFVIIINGYNLIDDIDGLPSGLGILTSSVLGFWFWKTGNIAYTVMSFALTGTLISFFWCNIFSKKNKIVMGDIGSLTIGLVMAILTVRFIQMDVFVKGGSYIHAAPVFTAGILIIPLFNLLRILIYSIIQGKSIFAVDHQHIHHLVLQLGMNQLQVTLILLAVNIVFVIMCYFLQNIGIHWLLAIVFGTAVLLTQLLVYFSNNRAKQIMTAEYYSIVKA